MLVSCLEDVYQEGPRAIIILGDIRPDIDEFLWVEHAQHLVVASVIVPEQQMIQTIKNCWERTVIVDNILCAVRVFPKVRLASYAVGNNWTLQTAETNAPIAEILFQVQNPYLQAALRLLDPSVFRL